MSAQDFVFQPLDLSQGSEDEYICLNKFKNKMNLEYRPDDPPIPLEEHKQGWKNIPSFVEYEAYGEKSMFARGNQRWTMYIVDRANGKTTGLTEVVWNLDRAMILNQGFTAVLPDYRNTGMGRWLKTEMMQKVLHDRPEVKFIRTGNANSNAPMLKINNEMGFKPYIANTVWQVETEKVEKYLSEKQP